MSSDLVQSLIDASDDILKIREDIGALKALVYRVTRRWTGTRPGEGHAVDNRRKMFPQPGIRDYSQDVRLVEAGYVKQGDLILTNISKKRYERADLDGSTAGRNIEEFWEVDGRLFRTVNVKEKLVTWDVQIRPLTRSQ